MGKHAHTFSFFFANLSNLATGKPTKINEPGLVYRLFGVVRKKPGQNIILFNDDYHAESLILECNKRSVIVQIEKKQRNTQLYPSLISCIGLTKKSAFEDAVYISSALGVQTIIPMVTKQTERNWLQQKELERLYRIAIAAREQSKNFCPTTILKPITLENLEKLELGETKIVLEKGMPNLIKRLPSETQTICMAFGPEGGFLKEELEYLKRLNFQMCGLVPTTLRTNDAVGIAAGIIRSHYL